MSDEENRKTTAQIPREDILSALLTDIQKRVTEGFVQVDGRLDTIEKNVDLVGGQTKSLEGRMVLIEQRTYAVEQRQDSGSIRARSESSTNETQTARLDTIEQKLAENTAVTTEIKTAMTDKKSGAMIVYEDLKKSPTFARVMYAFATFLLAALGYGAMQLHALASKVP